MKASLVLVLADRTQRDIPLKTPRTVIGRDTACQIRIPVGAVSRQHCEVLVEGPRIVIRDLKSSNGTYVNRERQPEAELHAGDVLSIGPAVFVVKVDGKPATVDSQATLRAGTIAAAGAAGAPSGAKAPTAAMSATPSDSSKPKSLLDDFEFDDDEEESKPKSKAAAKSGQGTGKSAPAAPKKSDNDDSSMTDFDFLDDDEEDQPKL